MWQTTLYLTDSHLHLIREHLDSEPDQEVCGLIGGVWQPFDRIAIAKTVIAIPNISETPRVRYYMNPESQIRAMLDFEKDGWELIGVYHSHPRGDPIPSPTDIAESFYPDVIYLIGVPGGHLKAWRIVGDQVTPVTLEIQKID